MTTKPSICIQINSPITHQVFLTEPWPYYSQTESEPRTNLRRKRQGLYSGPNNEINDPEDETDPFSDDVSS